MDKENYLNHLRAHLSPLGHKEIQEILRDQREYIEDAMASGLSEATVLERMGPPRQFARKILAESQIHHLENNPPLSQGTNATFKALLLLLVSLPFHFLMLIGPFLASVVTLFSLWITEATLFIVLFAFWLTFAFKLLFIDLGAMTHLSAFFGLLSMSGLVVLTTYWLILLSKVFFQMVAGYLRWAFQLPKNNF